MSAAADDLIRPGTLALRVSQLDGAYRIEALGELDLAGVPALATQLARALESPATEVHLDLSGLGFIDSTGLGEIVRAQRECDRNGCEFRVLRATGQVAEIIRFTGLDAVLDLRN
jgi:anti-sigma B factor antagonist